MDDPHTVTAFFAALGLAGVFLAACFIAMVANEMFKPRVFWTACIVAAIALPTAIYLGMRIS